MADVIPLAIFAASQIGTPGPANMALLASGASFGFARSLSFIAGVVLGKQILIWPIGIWLVGSAGQAPAVLAALKWISVAAVVWVVWRIAGTSIRPGTTGRRPFRFALGLLIHPFNPKAWAMIIAALTVFSDAANDPLQTTAMVAIVLFACQIVFHPLWTFGGARIAGAVAGTRFEPYLMWTLAALTVASVAVVLIPEL